jgi:hypothetical protein
MIEVIEKGGLPQVKCGRCESVLEYTKDDCKLREEAFACFTMGFDMGYYVECPLCGNGIRVKDFD